MDPHSRQLAEKAVDNGVSILILTDRALSSERVPIPSLMVTGAVHHHLNNVRKRMRASIVVETGEARDTHQIACLFGFGATAVCNFLLAFAKSAAFCANFVGRSPTARPEMN